MSLSDLSRLTRLLAALALAASFYRALQKSGVRLLPELDETTLKPKPLRQKPPPDITVEWVAHDKEYGRSTTGSIPSGATWVFDHPFFIVLNVAVGGAWPGDPDVSTVFPQQMLVDYVRVYHR